MKILFVTNNYTPYSGGVVSSINATVHALQKKGHEVRIVTFQFLREHNDPEYVYRIPTFFKFVYKKNRMIFGWRGKKFLHNVMRDFAPDIIHIHHPFLLGPAAVSVARTYCIPTIFTYHTMYEAYTHYVPLPRMLVNKLLAWRMKKFIRSVDGVIAPSSQIRKRITLLDIQKPVWIIPSGLQEQFAQLVFYKKEYQMGKPFELIVVSRFVKEKNVQAALDVLAQLPDCVHLTLVGYGAQEAELRAYAYEKLTCSADRVRFIIDPPKDIVPALYQNAHLFVFTSKTDTQGLVLAESMAASTPVVAFPGPGQHDIIVDGENGYILADKAAMVQQIITIIHNSEIYRHVQRGAFKTSQKYHADVLCDTLLTAYNLLIASSN